MFIEEIPRRLVQQRQLAFDNLVELHLAGAPVPAREPVRGDPTPLGQPLQADQQRIAREGRQRRIW